MLIYILLILFAIMFFIILFLYISARKEMLELYKLQEELLYENKSIRVKHGMSFEQLFPFMKNYPYSTRNFRFIGTPVDGVSFEDDKIVFVEFKTGSSRLSPLQKKIRDLVLGRKVIWEEIRDS